MPQLIVSRALLVTPARASVPRCLLVIRALFTSLPECLAELPQNLAAQIRGCSSVGEHLPCLSEEALTW